jgi:flagellar hook-associated protein 2
MSMNFQLSGLVSGFDWKSFVDTMMQLERAPASRLEMERLTNNTRLTALGGLESRLNDLRSAIQGLTGDLFGARSTQSSDSSWQTSAAAHAPSGHYRFEMLAMATTAQLHGGNSRAAGLAPTNDVSDLTMATLGTALPVTAGEFTINGVRVSVDLADSLEEVFDRINSATDGAVTASYDATNDQVTLSGSGPIMLGASNDTSNLLTALRLQNNGANLITSAGTLGAVNLNAGLAHSRLSSTLGAVDTEGNGSFVINGVTIAYNVEADSLAAVIARINHSDAGVRLAYDALADRFTLTNIKTGDLGITTSESGPGLLSALGLTAEATLVAGTHARFRVNDGPERTSADNTLTAATHGIDGLSVTPRGNGTTSDITIGTDAALLRGKINTFIARFNAVQTYLEDQTRITRNADKVTTSALSNNREVQNWATTLRGEIFAAVPGLSETLNRLDHLGIDFTPGSSNLFIKDETRLSTVLSTRPDEVAALFNQTGTGFIARMEARFNSYLGLNGAGGLLAGQKSNLNASNDSIARQIADIDRRLVQRRSQLESTFIAMEAAQAKINQMQSQLLQAFPAHNTSNKK